MRSDRSEVLLTMRTNNPARRARRSFSTLAVVTGTIVGALVMAVVLGTRLLHQPFTTKIVDRTPPVTLQQLRAGASRSPAPNGWPAPDISPLR